MQTSVEELCKSVKRLQTVGPDVRLLILSNVPDSISHSSFYLISALKTKLKADLATSPPFFFSLLQSSRFNNTDQNQLPLGEPQKLSFSTLDQFEQPLQHRRQSLGDLAALDDSKEPTRQQQLEQSGWIYEEANTMLRDLHFERVHRLGRSDGQ